MSKKNPLVSLVLREKLQELEKSNALALEKLKLARLDGDLSENADWVLLKEKVDSLQTQIVRLKAKIAEANPESDKIITYRLLETGEKKTIQLTNWEINAKEGKISRVSPLGVILNNKKVGQIAEVKIGPKKYRIQILGIKIL